MGNHIRCVLLGFPDNGVGRALAHHPVVQGRQLHKEEGQLLSPQIPPVLDQRREQGAVAVRVGIAVGLALVIDHTPQAIGSHLGQHGPVQGAGTMLVLGAHHRHHGAFGRLNAQLFQFLPHLLRLGTEHH